MDNTEATPPPGESVETAREASTREAAGQAIGSGCPHCGVLAVSSTEALLNRSFRKFSISYSTQQVVLQRGFRGGGYHVDLLIVQRPIAVEADERYHAVQWEQREHDARKDADLRKAGYVVYRFTEDEIGTDADACAWLVIEREHLEPEESPTFVIRKAMSGPDSPTWTGGKPPVDCAICGKHFHAYHRNGKPRMTCSRECQCLWQAQTGASVRGRRSNGESMRALWNDPAWRAKQTKLISNARWHNR